jgi:glutamate carboxypeptidase
MNEALRNSILSCVEGRSEEQVEYIVKLCEQNSYTYNAQGTNLVAEMLLDRLGPLFPHRESCWQDSVGNNLILRTRPDSESIYLLGHMDTVFPPDHPFQECRFDGEWVIGPGVGDMKGGLAVIVYALSALAEVGVLEGIAATVVLGADEEVGSVTSHAIYENERSKAWACLVAECAGPAGEVVLSRNGKAGIKMKCRGESRHVGRVSGGKRSAILELAHKIVALEDLNGCYPGVSVNVGTVEGGLGPCTVPGRASCLVDLRWRTDEYYEQVLRRVREIAEEPIQPGCDCGVEILNRRPAMARSRETDGLYEKLRGVAGSMGVRLGSEHRQGSSDANYFGAAGVPTVDGLGPVCEDDHTPSERVHIPSIASRTSLLALFLAEYGKNGQRH